MKERPLKIYFAAPLFTQAERIWNRMLKKEIENIASARGLKIKILFPQDIVSTILNNECHSDKLGEVYQQLNADLFKADILIAILDGPDSDSGTSAEAYGAKIANKKIIGVRTDFRNSGEEKGLNIMLARACDKFITFPSFNEDYTQLAEEIIRAIQELKYNK